MNNPEENFLSELSKHLASKHKQIEQNSIILEIAKNHLVDLTTIRNGYFSLEDQQKITERSAQLFAERLENAGTVREAWQSVAEDFHKNYWGFSPQKRKPKIVRSEQNLGVQMMIKVVQGFIVMKVIIVFLGSRYVLDPTRTNGMILVIAFLGSLLSMAWFAWRQRHKSD